MTATKRATRSEEISQDLQVAGFIEGWVESSSDPDEQALLPRVREVRKRIGRRQVTETRWMDREPLERVRTEMAEVERTEMDTKAIFADISGHITDLENRHK